MRGALQYATNNYPGHVIPGELSRENYPGTIIGFMVRLPLTPAEVERGRRLGALLRRARGQRSMLQTALDARVSPETLRKIESGRVATPAFTTIAAIADVLGLSLDEVWAEMSSSGAQPTGATERLVS
jgi:DNA-binding XRE family transcriptional regulator